MLLHSSFFMFHGLGRRLRGSLWAAGGMNGVGNCGPGGSSLGDSGLTIRGVTRIISSVFDLLNEVLRNNDLGYREVAYSGNLAQNLGPLIIH